MTVDVLCPLFSRGYQVDARRALWHFSFISSHDIGRGDAESSISSSTRSSTTLSLLFEVCDFI